MCASRRGASGPVSSWTNKYASFCTDQKLICYNPTIPDLAGSQKMTANWFHFPCVCVRNRIRSNTFCSRHSCRSTSMQKRSCVLCSCGQVLTLICKGSAAKSVSSDGQQSAVGALTGIRGSQTIQSKLEGKCRNQVDEAIKLPAPLQPHNQQMLYCVIAFEQPQCAFT